MARAKIGVLTRNAYEIATKAIFAFKDDNTRPITASGSLAAAPNTGAIFSRDEDRLLEGSWRQIVNYGRGSRPKTLL